MNAFMYALEIAWNPGLRGILVVLVGTAVLVGSIYGVLGTNLGARVGVLVSVAGLSGWMMLMGIVWALYGIGYKGPAPHWKVEEIVTSSSPSDLSSSRLAVAHDLGAWHPQPADDPRRGEEQAAAAAALTADDSPVQGVYESDQDFITIGAYDKGGKKGSVFNDWVPGPHPPHYAIIQVQRVKDRTVPFGEKPPAAEADPSAPVHTVVLVRDLGALRLPPVTLAISMGIVFAITCNALHRRDKQLMAARAAAAVT